MRFCSQNLAVVSHCITLLPSLCLIHSPTPSHSLPLPPPCRRYAQAVVPGKPLDWNIEYECREEHSYNQVLLCLCLFMLPQVSHVDILVQAQSHNDRIISFVFYFDFNLTLMILNNFVLLQYRTRFAEGSFFSPPNVIIDVL